MGHIVLEGGAEFGGWMKTPDRRSLALAGGTHVPVCIIPAAAAPDHNHHRAGQNGLKWFQSLGANNITILPLIDRKSADDPVVVSTLQQAKLIYFLGGFPSYLAKTMAGSDAWEALSTAFRKGAVVAGSSAGAMVICEYYYAPSSEKVRKGLGLVPGVSVLPHHNTFGQTWSAHLLKILPDTTLIGIDEETGLIDDGSDGWWRVYGKGSVTLYRGKRIEQYRSGKDVLI